MNPFIYDNTVLRTKRPQGTSSSSFCGAKKTWKICNRKKCKIQAGTCVASFFAGFTLSRHNLLLLAQSTNASISYHGKKAQVGRNSTPASNIFRTLCFLLRGETYEEYHTFEEVMEMYRSEQGV